MKLGIPKGFLFYRKQVLWTTFFQELNIPLIISEDSTNQTLQEGKQYANSEDCLAYKLYLGQIKSLLGKCDAILIPRMEYVTPTDTVCAKYQGIYDVAKNLFKNTQWIDYDINILKEKTEKKELLRIGKLFGKTEEEIKKAYQKASEKEQQQEQNLFLIQEKKHTSTKKKILILSHSYEIYDRWIGGKILTILKKLDVEILYADHLPKKIAQKQALKADTHLTWLFQKELLGAYEYYKEKVDGILCISCFPCGCDALLYEKILRTCKIPAICLVMDEQSETGGIETRLESFVDIIKEGEMIQ